MNQTCEIIIHVCFLLFCLHLSSGKFSNEELDDLRTEFTHHKDKVKEYNRLLRVLTDHDDISENSVFSRGDIKEKELEKLRNKLQDSHESLTKNYARLKEKATEEKEGTSLFRDRRVTELWQKAQNGKFSDEELESIKVHVNTFSFENCTDVCTACSISHTCNYMFALVLFEFPLLSFKGILKTFYSE